MSGTLVFVVERIRSGLGPVLESDIESARVDYTRTSLAIELLSLKNEQRILIFREPSWYMTKPDMHPARKHSDRNGQCLHSSTLTTALDILPKLDRNMFTQGLCDGR